MMLHLMFTDAVPSSSHTSHQPAALHVRCDEFFDAEEYIDELESESESEQSAFRLAVHASGLSLVLLDDHDTLARPLLMATLQPLASRGCSVARVHGALTLDASLRLAVFAYRRAAAAQGWEPVLEPCHLELALDAEKRLFSFSSCGGVELNVSPAFVRLAVPLLGRAGAEGRGQLRTPTAFAAPFRLRNLTGTQLSFWADGIPRSSLEAGAAASLCWLRVPRATARLIPASRSIPPAAASPAHAPRRPGPPRQGSRCCSCSPCC